MSGSDCTPMSFVTEGARVRFDPDAGVFLSGDFRGDLLSTGLGRYTLFPRLFTTRTASISMTSKSVFLFFLELPCFLVFEGIMRSDEEKLG